MVEQLLASRLWVWYLIVVSNVGSAAISAVSLVDSINILVIQLFLRCGGRRRDPLFPVYGKKRQAGGKCGQSGSFDSNGAFDMWL